MIIEQIRATLPTHIMLTPEVHKYRDGDEWFSDGGWKEFSENDCKYFKYKHSIRRPIPAHILDNQAFWIWTSQFNGVVPTWDIKDDLKKWLTE